MDDDDEDYILYGTSLPEIEDEATLKKKAVKELQVRDEKGRQRFHGAFTGGFSAGYFNTVGTKEGWAPSTFTSTRNKIADRIQQNPEDFMDDEDFGEFGIATRKIHTTSNFQDASDRSSQKRKFVDTDGVIPGEAPLKDIVQPIRESIGIVILRKLGWRVGQGIGPRVKKVGAGARIYGCSPFPDTATNEAEDDPTAASFTFAPKDTESMSYKSKDNYFGLGYTGLSKQSILKTSVDPFSPTSTKSWLDKDKKKLKISGQAFGVGAFEDEDEDIYGKDDMSQYDFSDLALNRSEDSQKATDAPKLGSFQGVLAGFCLAVQPPVVKKHYPPPTLPPHFKPVHLKITYTASPKIDCTQSRHSLSASDRSLLLGEKKFQKVSLNVPNIVAEKKKPDLEQTQSLPSSSATVPNFCLFPNDLSKQQRYEDYIKLKQTGEIVKFVQPASMTEWEKQQELEEFAKSAVFFKPLSNVLSSRFKSGSHLSLEHEVVAAIEKMKREKEEKQTDAKKNLVGSKNRKTFEWHPVPLLCKRMNVPNPYPNSGSSGTQSVLQKKSVFDHLTVDSDKPQNLKEADISVSTVTNDLQSNKNVPKENQNQTSDIITSVKNNEGSERPPMDFFKDIFENSSSDDDEAVHEKPEISENIINENELAEQNNVDILEKDKNAQNSVVKETVKYNQKAVLNDSSTGSKKAGFGVFANLDLDALNQRKPAIKTLHSDVLKSKIEDSEVTCSSNLNDGESDTKQLKSDDLYGPELPPNYSVLDTSVSLVTSCKSSLKKHAKSSHKHKHHKHKHKKKKKKSSKRESSSADSSEDELGDIPPSLIIEKMKKLQKKKF